MNRNPVTVNGTPSLATGLLTVDQDQALTFNGTTNSATAPDSASLSQTGSMSLEALIKLPSIPGTTKDLVAKSNSYALQVSSAGKLLWHLDSGGGTVTVTSATTIASGTAYHVVGVYNGEYAGATTSGHTTLGTTTTPILGDYYQGSPSGHSNKMATKVSLLERGLITSVVMDVVRTPDSTLDEYVRAHVYTGGTAATATKVGESADVALSTSSLPARAWTTFPLAAIAEPGDYWIGPAGGESSQAFSIGCEASGGTTVYKNDLLSDDLSDPFGTPGSSDAKVMAVYMNYTPIARTGLEGKALLYVNGTLDASSAYTSGIANNGTALNFGTAVAVTLDEVSIWDRALSPVEIATHYTAR